MHILDFDFTLQEIADIRAVADSTFSPNRFTLHKAANALEALASHKRDMRGLSVTLNQIVKLDRKCRKITIP